MTLVTTYRGFDIHRIEAREFSEILGSRNGNNFPIYVPHNGPFNASTMQKKLDSLKKFIDLRYREIEEGQWGKDGEILNADSGKFVPKPEIETKKLTANSTSPAHKSHARRLRGRARRGPRNLRERAAYARRGNRTKEEYNAHMAKSKADYWADKNYIETYRDVEIYMHPNRSYEAKDHAMSAGDIITLRYLIDSKIDTGSAEDEVLEGSSAIYSKSRRRAQFRSLESRQPQSRGTHGMKHLRERDGIPPRQGNQSAPRQDEAQGSKLDSLRDARALSRTKKRGRRTRERR